MNKVFGEDYHGPLCAGVVPDPRIRAVVRLDASEWALSWQELGRVRVPTITLNEDTDAFAPVCAGDNARGHAAIASPVNLRVDVIHSNHQSFTRLCDSIPPLPGRGDPRSGRRGPVDQLLLHRSGPEQRRIPAPRPARGERPGGADGHCLPEDPPRAQSRATLAFSPSPGSGTRSPGSASSAPRRAASRATAPTRSSTACRELSSRPSPASTSTGTCPSPTGGVDAASGPKGAQGPRGAVLRAGA